MAENPIFGILLFRTQCKSFYQKIHSCFEKNIQCRSFRFHRLFISKDIPKSQDAFLLLIRNKCSIATRIDSFSDEPTHLYGEKLREQVEEWLKFYETDVAPCRNVDVMEDVAKQLKVVDDDEKMEDVETPKKKDKKRKEKKRKYLGDSDDEDEKKDEKKSAKKAKKAKKDEDAAETPKKAKTEDAAETPKSEKKAKTPKKDEESAETPKSEKKSDRKKKKRKSKRGD